MLADAGPTLAPAIDAVRLTLHVLAATVWVGGQFTMAGLVPTARRLGADAPRALARAFGRLMWPAYLVLVVTGLWNVGAVGSSHQTAWKAVLGAKIATVAVAGLAALWHQRSTSRRGLAVGGAVAALASTAALALGVLLAG